MTRSLSIEDGGVRAGRVPYPAWLRLTWRHRRWTGPALVLLAWSLIGAARWLPPSVLPMPWAVVWAAVDALGNGKLLPAVGISTLRLVIGFVLGSAFGLALGLAAGLWRHGEELLDGTLQALRAIPFLALAPLFNLWFSNDEAAKIMLVGFGTTFPLYLSATAGIRSVDVRLLEAAKVSGLTPAERIREVILPGASPQVFTGLRIGFGWALAALVSAELTSSASGLGAVVAEAREYVQTDLLFVCAITYALLGLAADGVLRLVAARLLPWRQAYAGK